MHEGRHFENKENALYNDEEGVSELGKVKIKSSGGEFLGDDIEIKVGNFLQGEAE